MIKDFFALDDVSKHYIPIECIGCGTCSPGEFYCLKEKKGGAMNKNVCPKCGEVHTGKNCPTCNPKVLKKEEEK